MIKVNQISKTFFSNKVLEQADITFIPGKVSTIVAPNGAGKTTLVSIISGLLIPDSGQVEFINPYSEKDVNIVFSGEKNLYMKNTVLENLYYFGVIRGMSKKDIKARIEIYSKYIPVYEKIENTLVEKLSYGQKRLIAILAAVVSNAKCIIIDEVSEGLDMDSVNILKKMIRGIGKDQIVILASHDYEFVAEVSDSIYLLKSGKVISILDKISKSELVELYKNTYDIEEEN